MIRYDYVEPPAEPVKAAEFLAKTFMPLFEEFWAARGKEFHGAERPDFQAADFVHMWLGRSLILLLAYENDEPAGFILGAQLRPLTHARRQLHVEAWYGRRTEMERGLFAHLRGILKFFPAEVVVWPHYDGADCPVPAEETDVQTYRRLVR